MRYGILCSLEKVTSLLAKGLAAAGSISLLCMAIVTTVDVIGRNLFDAPMRGALEIVSVGLTLTLFGGMPYAEMLNEHIRVDILTDRFSTTTRNALAAGMNWLYLLLVGLLSWQCWEQALFLLAGNSNSGVMGIPLAPFMFAVSFVLAVFFLAVLVNLLKSFALFFRGSRSWFLLALVVILGTFFYCPFRCPGTVSVSAGR